MSAELIIWALEREDFVALAVASDDIRRVEITNPAAALEAA